MKHSRAFAVTILFCIIAQMAAMAAEDAPSGPLSEKSDVEDSFQRGHFEASLTSGILFSPFVATGGRPVVNYILTELQIGYMLNEIKGDNALRGNFELAVDAYGGALEKGVGDYVAGGTLWLRYNFVPHDWKLVPYVQAGAGVTFTDIDPRILGERFNFNLNFGVGVRYFLSRNWSVNLEYRYQHISNANLSPNNVGINAHGPMLGVSFFF